MALTIRPTDNLIHRLLQQNSRTAETPRDQSSRSSQKPDQVNISPEARKQTSSQNTQQSSYSAANGYAGSHKQEDLEARLLNLYQQPLESSSENK